MIDPHLYPGVPLMPTRIANRFRWRMARFMAFSGGPYDRAWIVVFDAYNVAYPMLVDAHELRVSQVPKEPPELPAWAQAA